MSLITDLVGLGLPPEQANLVGAETVTAAPTRTVATGLTAAGTALADALALTSMFNVIGTAAASTGVKLPTNMPVGQWGIVQNNGANTVNIFPPSASGTINGGSGGAAVTTAAAAAALFVRLSSTDWGVWVLAKES